jgi:uncharacterized protein (TIRG00374 family)
MALKLRGALLGAGNIAQRGHAPQWLGDPVLAREVEIVAVADRAADNLRAALRLFPEARTYASAEALIEQEALEFVDVCTPPFTHGALIDQAADQGLHVLCEKPLAPTYEEAQRAAAAVRKAGIVFRPCHQYHYSPLWRTTLDLLPRIGRVHLVDYQVHRTAANPGNAHWTPNWRTLPELAGGGILIDHGAHVFYQLMSVLGEPQSIQAMLRTLQHRGYEVEDTAVVTVDFGAALAQLTLTWAARERAVHFHFLGERGELVGDEHRLRVVADTTEEVRPAEGVSGDSAHSGWYAPLFRDFVSSVRNGDAGSRGLEEAVQVARLIDTAYDASRRRCALALRDEPSTVAAMVGAFESPRPEVASATRRRGIWALRGAALTTLVLSALWTFHGVAWHDVLRTLRAADVSWILVAAGVNLLVLVFHSLRWFALVRPLSRTARLGDALGAMTLGFAVSTLVPARAGELARMEWLQRQTGLSRLSIVGSIILDHMVNASGLLLGIALLPFFMSVPLWMRPGGWLVLALFAVGATAIGLLRPLSRERTLLDERTTVPIRRVAALLAAAREGLAAVGRPRSLATSFGASMVAWTLEVNVTVFSMRAVGLKLPVVASILVLVAVNVALALPMAPPGNLGTLELGATLAVTEFGVAREQALAFALCYHLLQIIPIGLLGLLVATRAARRREPAWAAAPSGLS